MLYLSKICAFLHEGVLTEHLLCARCYPRLWGEEEWLERKHKEKVISYIADCCEEH